VQHLPRGPSPHPKPNLQASPNPNANSNPKATAAGDVIKKLPCAHKFHSKCIDAWLFHSPLCPFCRRSITTLDRWATRIVFEDRSGGAEGDEDAHFRDATEGQPLELHVHGALLSHGRRRFSSAGGDARGRR